MRITGLVCAACLCAGVAWGQFPDLPGKDVTIKSCGNCHEPERAGSVRQTKDGWEATLSAMASRGMALNDADYVTVLDYLTKAFPADGVPPLNINKASGIDMESALGLLRSQSALILAYREKHGDFKSMDDLKKVPGLDFSKLEAKKDRISFQ